MWRRRCRIQGFGTLDRGRGTGYFFWLCARAVGLLLERLFETGARRGCGRLTTNGPTFSEVAQLVDCTCLDIYAHLPASMLTPATAYVAYLVFATVDGHRGLSFPDQETTVSVGDHITSRHTVCLRPDIVEAHRFIGLEGCGSDDVRVPALRTDGWWEMEMGRLRTGGDDAMAREEEEVVASFEVLGWYPKCGLVVEGVEFRPLCL